MRKNPLVVVLEGCHCEIPKFNFEYEYKEYDNTAANEVLERVRDADIIVTTIVPVTAEVASQCPNLKLMAIMATGHGWLEKEYFAKRGITVINCPSSNIPAVSEHAIGLYFATRKRMVQMHNAVLQTNIWAEKGTLTKVFPGPPATSGQEIMGIIGYGALGKRIEMLAKGVGFTRIVVAERRGATPRPGRLELEEMLKTCTVVMVCCPKDESTIGLISRGELQSMRKDAILINMARGGIVDEAALAEALRSGWIEGAAVDVLEMEPASRGSTPLLPTSSADDVPNLTISPHISWFSKQTIILLQQLLKDGVDAFVAGTTPKHIIVGGRGGSET